MATTALDGRYYWTVDAQNPSGPPISFVGDISFLSGTCVFTWTITQASDDGSVPHISYSLDNGATFTDVPIGSAGSPQAAINESGGIDVDITSAIGIIVTVNAVGGTPDADAKPNIVAIAITRNANETLQWDSPNPFNPMNYNGGCVDEVVPTDTLLNLRKRLMIRLGFASQVNNIPAGMSALLDEFLISGQKYLYRKYLQLHTKRMFRWKLVPNQRFYSFRDNDEDVLCNYTLDPLKSIEWAGIQDTRNVWYPLDEGIPPQLYTMIDKPWRPARFQISQSLEVYPAPDQTYWLWLRGHFGLRTMAVDADKTTLDAELVFLHALANAKAHYGQPDANNIASEANSYRGELIAGTHGVRRYIPGTLEVPPAVRPTLLNFQNN